MVFGGFFCLFMPSLKPYLLTSMSTNVVPSGAASHSNSAGKELWSEEM